MNAEEYILQRLEKMREPLGLFHNDDVEGQIVKLVLSKRFRKYSASNELVTHVKDVVHYCVSKGQPLNFTFLHGAYKLWRLDEAPEADWAELFALMYYTNYVKPICEIYEPGVWFDFFVDDWIIEIIDNITPQEISTYLKSYQNIINFLRPYQPKNLKMTITPVSTQFTSRETFDKSMAKNLKAIELPKLSDSEARMVELNVRLTNGQSDDPLWKEKIYRLHNAYLATKSEPGYHKDRSDKILVFNQPLPSGTTISLGTTKSSIAKFWVGVGALKPSDESSREIILSPSQLQSAEFNWEQIDIGLLGKNFKHIRVKKQKEGA